MLQRAASNAYSWWWASHIRTKQSKWLDQNLQDMEDKVQYVLKLINEGGDSFAKRAEMYFKNRPEMINFVEESYRAYRALAERYDHISTELQNANNTLASVCPDQLHFSIDDDDDGVRPSKPQRVKSRIRTPKSVPDVPKSPIKEPKVAFASTPSIKLQPKKSTNSVPTVAKSGLSKPQALEEIDRLQKEILTLQTEKEFVKSTYESGISKYWEIDESMKEKQERICKLQDEFDVSVLIEDDEARSLMTTAALKSCQQTLAQLQEKQEKAARDAKIESKRIKKLREKMKSLKKELPSDAIDQETPSAKDETANSGDKVRSLDQETGDAKQAKQDLEVLHKKIKEHFEAGSSTYLTVTEMAEKIDELASKVINLETAVSTQTALVNRLRLENDELHIHIQNLESDKELLSKDAGSITKKMKEMEEKFQEVEELNGNFKNQNNNLQTHFIEATCYLDHLSEKMHAVQPDEERETMDSSQNKEWPLDVIIKEDEGKEYTLTPNSDSYRQQETKEEEEAGVTEASPKLEVNPKDESKGARETGTMVDAELPDQSERHEASHLDKEDSTLKDSSEKGRGSVGEGESLESSVKQETANISPSKESGPPDEVKSQGSKKKETSRDQRKNDNKILEKDEDEDLLGNGEKQKSQERIGKQASSKTINNPLDAEKREEETREGNEPDWRQLFVNGMENREKLLLDEYTTVLRNYEDVKKKLDEVEKKSDGSFVEVKMNELKNANAMKDQEILSLRQKLSLMQKLLDENKDKKDNTDLQESNVLDNVEAESLVTEDESEDVNEHQADQSRTTSPVEEGFRMSIDELLEQNLDFWLRFSTAVSQIQKFESEVQDLEEELSKIEERTKKKEGSSSSKYNKKSEVKPIYKHLKDKNNELTVWLEKSILLKEELKARSASLCDIQEDIKNALRKNAEDGDFTFTNYQAAKFQGEILNMKQENKKVDEELQTGLDLVTALQLEVEKTLANLHEEFKFPCPAGEPKSQLGQSDSRTNSNSKIPLQSFIFGVKPKKQKPSIFAYMRPAAHRKANTRRSGDSM